MSYPIAVIGAGLSGLYASYLLSEAGHDVVLIEGRERVGGRILSERPSTTTHRVDLGPSWFWPDMNPRVERMVNAFQLPTYPQYSQGDFMVEAANGQVRRQKNHWSQTESYRIEGGTQQLIETLHQRLNTHVDLQLQTRLVSMVMQADCIELSLTDGQRQWTQQASDVVVTIPPRLMAQDIHFQPAWPEDILQTMRSTPTWMANQAKFVVLYETPFWREVGLSGAAMSHRGPLIEVQDASDVHGQTPALFGFYGASAAYRAGIGNDDLAEHSLAQLTRLFGPLAANPLWFKVQDWARDPFTAASSDRYPVTRHPRYGAADIPDEWQQRLWLAGTERSVNYGGYLEGALESAEVAVHGLLARQRAAHSANHIMAKGISL